MDELQQQIADLTNKYNELNSRIGQNEYSNNIVTSKDLVMQNGSYRSNNFVTGSVGWQIDAEGNVEFSNGVFRGTITASSGTIGSWNINATSIYTGTEDHSGYTTNAGDVTLYSDGTDASIHTFNWYIDTAGVFHTRSGDITGNSISGIPNDSSTDISLLGWQQNMTFSATDLDTVAWTSGTITLSNGRTFSISAGNTGNMAAVTYIYLDTGTSSTVLQTTTTAATAVGANKILVATAQNSATGINAIFSVITGNTLGGLPVAINGSHVSTLSISGKTCLFDTGTIGGFSMSATTLSATNFTVTSGAANTANLSVGTGSNLAGLNSGNASSDIAFWAGATFANRATAPFRVDMAGNATMTSVDLPAYGLIFGIPFTSSVDNLYSTSDAFVGISGTTIQLVLGGTTNLSQARDVTSDWADADVILGCVVHAGFVYIHMRDNATAPDTHRVYKYTKTNLVAGGTLITFSGATVLAQTDATMRMSSDGTNIFFNYQAGNSANDYDLAKYSVSGSTLTYVSTISLGSTAARVRNFHGKTNGEFVALSDTGTIRRYNSSGTLQAASAFSYGYNGVLHSVSQNFYLGNSTTQLYYKLFID